MNIKLIPQALMLTIVTALLAACSKQEAAPEPVRAVKVMTVADGSLQSQREFAGEVQARVESNLGFRVAGKIVARSVGLGQTVKAGQLLARLDPQDYLLSAQAAKAQVAVASTNRNLAQADYKRYKELRDQNFIGSAQLEKAEAALNAAQAQVEQAQAQLSAQRNQAAYTNLVADISGVVTAVMAERGQVVAAGSPVLRIAQNGPRDVVFSVPEDNVGHIKVGAGAVVRAWSGVSDLKGVVREVAANADPVTRTFTVKLSLEVSNPALAPPLGSTVKVLPDTHWAAERLVIKVPTSALRMDAKTTAVWVLDKSSMTIRLQPITVGSADVNDAVVTAGLTPGMVIVVAGVHVLNPGQKVTIFQERGSNPEALPVMAASAAK